MWTGASAHDGKIFDLVRPELTHNVVYGDKAYQRPDANEIQQTQGLTVLTPVKKQPGQQTLDADEQWLSTAVSRVRQPIEGLFHWIEQQTGIQCASNVRSFNGLMVHVFGKLAALCFTGISCALALNSHFSFLIKVIVRRLNCH